MESLIGNETTLFIGNYYQETTVNSVTTITKYYYAGASRVAMKVNGTLSYLFSDHLGSTSLITDQDGNEMSAIRYDAWGKVRYASPDSTSPLPTQYTYTGQFSDMDDPTTNDVEEGFGLMFYNARWYDPYLNHFTQPDSIIPDPNNSQDWDRYVYARNNPVRYTDPTGHDPAGNCYDKGYCKKVESIYDIKLTGKWTDKELDLLEITLGKLANYVGGIDNFNEAINIATDGKGMIIERVSGKYVLGQSRASECDATTTCKPTNTIQFSDDMFNPIYQTTTSGALYKRPPELGLDNRDSGVQLSMAHEFVHMLSHANPDALKYYESSGLGNREEDMANTIATYVVSNGATWAGHADQTTFSWNAQYFWYFNP